MGQILDGKLAQLRTILQSLDCVFVAFSGGVDSSFLLAAAVQTLGPENVTAVIGHSPLRPAREYEQAVAFVENLGVGCTILGTEELNDKHFVCNLPDRCYFCKKSLLTDMIKAAAGAGVLCVIEGSNEDDLTDYRPGSKAVQELGVRSPLQEAHLTKDDIRRISRELGLSTWDNPAQPCLATRFPRA